MITSTKNNPSSYVILYNKANQAIKNALIGEEGSYYYWVNGEKKQVIGGTDSEWFTNVRNTAIAINLFNKDTSSPSTKTSFAEADFDLINGGVNSLEEYYSVLGSLNSINNIFSILPLYVDEIPFEIKADERKIVIPSNQAVYAVQGDHMAEWIFFSVPRYFDIMDFNSTKIYVQWKIGDVVGNTPIELKDITSVKETLIFGWPLHKEITANSGTLEFSVRFIKDDSGILDYSFATLPATIQIKTSLKHSLSAENTITSVGAAMQNLIINYPSYNTETAEKPVFGINIKSSDDGYETLNDTYTYFDSVAEKNITLDCKDFQVSAISPNAGGIINYHWKKIENPEASLEEMTSKDVSNSNTGDGIVTTPVYVEKKLTRDNYKTELFYYENNDNPIDFSIMGETELNKLLEDSANETIKLYVKGSSFKAFKPGEYYCQAINSFGIRSERENSNRFIVPSPIDISIDTSNSDLIYYLDNYKDQNFKFYINDTAEDVYTEYILEEGLTVDDVINLGINFYDSEYNLIDFDSIEDEDLPSLSLYTKDTINHPNNLNIVETIPNETLYQRKGVITQNISNIDTNVIVENTNAIVTEFNIALINTLNNTTSNSNTQTIKVYNPLSVPDTRISYSYANNQEFLVLGSGITTIPKPSNGNSTVFLKLIEHNPNNNKLNPYNAGNLVEVKYIVKNVSSGEEILPDNNAIYTLSTNFMYDLTTTYTIKDTGINLSPSNDQRIFIA